MSDTIEAIDYQAFMDHFRIVMLRERDTRRAIVEVVNMAHRAGRESARRRMAPSAGTLEATAEPGHGTPEPAAAL